LSDEAKEVAEISRYSTARFGRVDFDGTRCHVLFNEGAERTGLAKSNFIAKSFGR
jgi:hypothetical protein